MTLYLSLYFQQDWIIDLDDQGNFGGGEGLEGRRLQKFSYFLQRLWQKAWSVVAKENLVQYIAIATTTLHYMCTKTPDNH